MAELTISATPAHMDPGFSRHIAACNNAVLPGDRTALRIGDDAVGWVAPGLVDALRALPELVAADGALVLTQPAALPEIARALAARGHYRWRDEAFDVRAAPGGPVLTTIDRGALPAFGIQAEGVHVNGLVRRPDGLHLWVARRAADKLLDPGKLDHIVAGGISAGMDATGTLLKEAAEEAAIPPTLAATAKEVGRVAYAMERPEGLRRDVLFCYDLELPDTFVPRPADGEVEGFELWPIARAIEAVRTTNVFKFNVNLVLIDLFARLGILA